MIILSATANPTSIKIGEKTTIQIQIENDESIDYFNIGGQVKRRTDGKLIGLYPVFPRVHLNTGDKANILYNDFGMPPEVGDEGVYDLELVYIRESDMQDFTLTPNITISIEDKKEKANWILYGAIGVGIAILIYTLIRRRRKK